MNSLQEFSIQNYVPTHRIIKRNFTVHSWCTHN